MKNRAIIFLFIAGMSSTSLAIADYCRGTYRPTCNAPGGTPSSCANQYEIVGGVGFQCQWIDGCSYGPAHCIPPASAPKTLPSNGNIIFEPSEPKPPIPEPPK